MKEKGSIVCIALMLIMKLERLTSNILLMEISVMFYGLWMHLTKEKSELKTGNWSMLKIYIYAYNAARNFRCFRFWVSSEIFWQDSIKFLLVFHSNHRSVSRAAGVCTRTGIVDSCLSWQRPDGTLSVDTGQPFQELVVMVYITCRLCTHPDGGDAGRIFNVTG